MTNGSSHRDHAVFAAGACLIAAIAAGVVLSGGDATTTSTGHASPAPHTGSVSVRQVQHGPLSNEEDPVGPAVEAPEPPETDGPVVQLAILLDTSNSMDGLIDQARANIWQIVNDLGRFSEADTPVQLQVALYQYGNDGLPSTDGHVQLRSPFTCDLDVLSEQLFSLRTNGGSEYCGWVIDRASRELGWMPPREGPEESATLRLMIIAGNEPFTQGAVNFRDAVANASNRGVRVYTVFCGDHSQGVATFWEEGGLLGEGGYYAIDHNTRELEIETPFDSTINNLNDALNKTYIPYGAHGKAAGARQAKQDKLSKFSLSAFFSRAKSKSSRMYTNAAWDLVDAYSQESIDLEELERASLPESLQEMSTAELEAHIVAAYEERLRINASIAEASNNRSQYIAEHTTRDPSRRSLGDAVVEAIRTLGEEAGLKVKPE